MNVADPSRPPEGPLGRDTWQGDQPSHPSRPGAHRSVLTHAAAVAAGLAAGGLIGYAAARGSADDPPANANAAATATVTPPQTTETSSEPEGPKASGAEEFAGDGTYVVGRDIKPGTHRTDGPQGGLIEYCTWSRLSSTSGEVQDIIASNTTKGQTTVTISSTDKAFSTDGCKPWKADE